MNVMSSLMTENNLKLKEVNSKSGELSKKKEEIEKDVLLSYPDYRPEVEKMELYVDASGTGVGACLLQPGEDESRVIAYGSMTFSETQKRYSVRDRELAAVRWGILNFRCFFGWCTFHFGH